MKALTALEALEKEMGDHEGGLPEEVFLFVSRHTPIVCVDLLIQNGQAQTLLSWRDDRFFGRGWHLPGGVIRFRESREERIRKVAQLELGAGISFDETPRAIQEYRHFGQQERGHQFVFLMLCRLTTAPDESRRCRNAASPAEGEWMWFERAPELIDVHQVYAPYIDDPGAVQRVCGLHVPVVMGGGGA